MEKEPHCHISLENRKGDLLVDNSDIEWEVFGKNGQSLAP